MAESESRLPDNCRQRLDDYLDAIDLALLRTTATRESRRSVIDMVEAQVIEMCCTNLDEESSEAAIGELFDRLDPPEMYAEAFDQRVREPAPKKKAKQRSGVSHHAIASVIALAAPFLVLLLTLQTGDFEGLFALVALLGWIGAPVLSWVALRVIDRSNGRVTGRRLAMISFYLVPLILTNYLAAALGVLFGDFTILLCVAVTMALINAGAIWLIRYAIDRWCQTGRNGISRPKEVPIGAGTAVG